ncbi:MAG: hypothetical protein ACKVQS_11845 [Fimbriimonadaceae bacterium]
MSNPLAQLPGAIMLLIIPACFTLSPIQRRSDVLWIFFAFVTASFAAPYILSSIIPVGPPDEFSMITAIAVTLLVVPFSLTILLFIRSQNATPSEFSTKPFPEISKSYFPSPIPWLAFGTSAALSFIFFTDVIDETTKVTYSLGSFHYLVALALVAPLVLHVLSPLLARRKLLGVYTYSILSFNCTFFLVDTCLYPEMHLRAWFDLTIFLFLNALICGGVTLAITFHGLLNQFIIPLKMHDRRNLFPPGSL